MQIRDIRQTTWFWVDNSVMDMNLTSNQFTVYCLLVRMSKENVCYPSMRAVAKKLHLGLTTVNEAIKKLKELNLISVESGDKDASNVYTILGVTVGNTASAKVLPQATQGVTVGDIGVLPQAVHNNTNNNNTNNNKDASLPTNKLLNTNIPPNQEWVVEYCKERKNGVDPIKWFNFYAAKGWMVGKNKMKDWRAAVRTWEQNNQTPVNTGLRV